MSACRQSRHRPPGQTRNLIGLYKMAAIGLCGDHRWIRSPGLCSSQSECFHREIKSITALIGPAASSINSLYARISRQHDCGFDVAMSIMQQRRVFSGNFPKAPHQVGHKRMKQAGPVQNGNQAPGDASFGESASAVTVALVNSMYQSQKSSQKNDKASAPRRENRSSELVLTSRAILLSRERIHRS